jgi:hypothetical protein
MEGVRYSVHTKTCTFLLDEGGTCLWIVSRTGVVPSEIRGAVGAQFVACMHPDLDGLLAGEILIGAAALFVKRDPEADRMVLMRTGTITQVDNRGSRASIPPVASTPLSDHTLDLDGGAYGRSSEPPPSRGGDTVPPPAWVRAAEGETTVTLTLPLYSAGSPRRLPPR